MGRYRLSGFSLQQQEGLREEVVFHEGVQLASGPIGDLRQQIREQIICASQNSPEQKSKSLIKSVNDAVGEIIRRENCDAKKIAAKLALIYQEFSKVYLQADIPNSLRTRQYICATGLVISPDHCTSTVKDTLRLYAFIRGVDKAISLQKEKVKEKRLHIVYPACGPFAPLLLPLVKYYHSQGVYSADELCVSFVDIQEGAIRSIRALVKALNIEAYVRDIACCNAMAYQCADPVHIVVLEALQHGFSREGHLQLAKYFASVLEADGIFLPQEISVGAALNVGQREYVDQWQDRHSEEEYVHSAQQIRQGRTELGTILKVDLPMLRTMKVQVQDEHTQLMACGSVTIPHLATDHDKQLLLIHSKVKVFDDEIINEYDSGITHPLPDLQVCVNFIPRDSRPGDLLVNSGDRLQFYYCMNGLPGFLPIKVDSQEGLSALTADLGNEFSSYA